MFWYSVTILSAICSIIIKATFADYNYTIGSLVVTGIFITVSSITTLVFIHEQERDYLNLGKIKSNIKAAIEKYKTKHKEINDLISKMFSHELEVIKHLSSETIKPEEFKNNTLSNNLLTQLPDLQAIGSVRDLVNDLNYSRGAVISNLREYNETVNNIKRRQGNSLIYTPFVKKYLVSFAEVRNLDDPPNIKLQSFEGAVV